MIAVVSETSDPTPPSVDRPEGKPTTTQVLHVDGCRVVQVKEPDRDGYAALQLGAGPQRFEAAWSSPRRASRRGGNFLGGRRGGAGPTGAEERSQIWDKIRNVTFPTGPSA